MRVYVNLIAKKQRTITYNLTFSRYCEKSTKVFEDHSEAHFLREARLCFCQCYQNWAAHDWSFIKRRIQVWISSGLFSNKNVKKISIWGRCQPRSDSLHRLYSNDMERNNYRLQNRVRFLNVFQTYWKYLDTILQSVVPQFASSVRKNFYLMLDNALSHTARIVTHWENNGELRIYHDQHNPLL